MTNLCIPEPPRDLILKAVIIATTSPSLQEPPNSAEDQGYGPRFVGAEASHPAAIAGPVRGGSRR